MGSQQSRIATAVELALGGATVIAANTRAARSLRLEVERQAFQSAKVCESPDIVPLEAWISRTWTDLLLAGAVDRALLKRNVLTALWREIVANSPAGRELLSHNAAAELAERAWQIIHDYKLPRSRSLYASTAESKAFFGWGDAFESRCTREGWIDSGAALAVITARGTAIPNLPKQVVVFGFDQQTPAQKDLWEALRAAGVTVRVLEPDAGSEVRHAHVVACADAADEMVHVARWARQKLEENPGARIGVIVPGLEGVRDQITTTFNEVLHPESLLLTAAARAKAFEISLGRPLGEHPMVRTALRILRLATSSLSADEFSALLRSPYLAAGTTEAPARALLDFKLRSKLRARVTLRQATDPDIEKHFAGARKLWEMLGALRARPLKSVRMAHTDWAVEAQRILDVLGWPGDEGEFTLNSEEFQVNKKWEELLKDFCALDQVLPTKAAGELLLELERAASEATFAVENEAAPVQIVGPIAASGESFDALWFCGLSDEAWPQKGHPNPFIPFALQKSAGAPHSSTGINRLDAERITSRVLQSADECVLSWPQREEDRELRASPLLAPIATVTTEELTLANVSGWESLQDGATLEDYEDETAPAISNDDLQSHRTNLLQWQSGCPFRAFAQARLAAEELKETALGANAIERGNIVDAALRHVWAELREWRNLTGGVREADVEKAITDAVDLALQEEFPKGEESWMVQHRAIERERLNRLLHEWLDLEKKRHPFQVVDSQVVVAIKLGELTLNGRIDRLDRTVDGDFVVIDYKTGSSGYSAKLWELPRPQEPQLPIYAVGQMLEQHQVAGVAFARVRSGNCEFNGLASKREIFGRTQNSRKYVEFPETLAKWQPELERLAGELLGGRAEVDPKNPPGANNSTCKHCHLGSLCRVAELTLIGDEDGEEGGDDE